MPDIAATRTPGRLSWFRLACSLFVWPRSRFRCSDFRPGGQGRPGQRQNGVSAGFALAAGHGQPPKPTARIPGWNHRLNTPAISIAARRTTRRNSARSRNVRWRGRHRAGRCWGPSASAATGRRWHARPTSSQTVDLTRGACANCGKSEMTHPAFAVSNSDDQRGGAILRSSTLSPTRWRP